VKETTKIIWLVVGLFAFAIVTAFGASWWFGNIYVFEKEQQADIPLPVITLEAYENPPEPVTIKEITITPEPEIVYEPVYIKTPPKNFGSVKEFNEFVDNYMNNRLVAIANNAPNKCEIYVMHLQRSALKAGYIMNFQVTGFHAQNLAVIGNEIWFCEPQTGETWKWETLD